MRVVTLSQINIVLIRATIGRIWVALRRRRWGKGLRLSGVRLYAIVDEDPSFMCIHQNLKKIVPIHCHNI